MKGAKKRVTTLSLSLGKLKSPAFLIFNSLNLRYKTPILEIQNDILGLKWIVYGLEMALEQFATTSGF